MDTMGLPTTGMRVEFVDRLRGYRFAAELRKTDSAREVRVWHTDGKVIIDLPGVRGTDARRAALAEESGGVVHPAQTSRPARPGAKAGAPA